MLPKNLFQKPKNPLESYDKLTQIHVAGIPDEIYLTCPSCKTAVYSSDLNDKYHLCPKCNYHFRINARQRINMIADENSFVEHDKDMESKNLLNFPGYEKKLQSSALESAEKEAVICGHATISNIPCAMFVMEPYFMMGSMGIVVGEKITRLFEYAIQHSLPVIGFTVSGGARMQEGILSLMQMAKTSGAVRKHSDAGNLYIAVLTNPTTGGVTASFAMEADIILAEPKALIGFAGPRVIEQTIRQKLPPNFQSSEFLLEKGFLDKVVSRDKHKTMLTALLSLHAKGVLS